MEDKPCNHEMIKGFHCQLPEGHDDAHYWVNYNDPNHYVRQAQAQSGSHTIIVNDLIDWAEDHLPRTSDQMAELYRQYQEEEIDRAINAHLDSLHSSTWGRMFYITQPDSREQCVEFIHRLYQSITNIKGRPNNEEVP